MNVKHLRWLGALLCVLATALLLGVSPVRTAPNKMWVAVMEDSTDACVIKTADRFGEILGVVRFNQQVEVLRDLSEDKENPRPYYRIKADAITGFIKRNALADKSQYQGSAGDSEAQVAVGASAANTAAKGLNSQNEQTLRKTDANFDKAVAQVEEMEVAVNRLVVGGDKPDPRKGLDAYRSWGEEGSNLPKEATTGGGGGR